MKKNSVSVEIYNKEYSISGDAEIEEIIEYAKYLDTKLRELANESPSLVSNYKLAILCALNIIEDLFKQKKLKNEVEKTLERISNLLNSVTDL